MSKIIRAEVHNFKRIEVAEITPNGTVVEVTGRNEQGKSSVLDAIEAALGGKRRQPSEPIRRGTKKARVVLELDDLVVERVWTSKSDRLVVKTKDGLHHAKAQAKLDELVGTLAFDPLEFMALSSGEQRETLLRVVGVDLDELDQRRAEVYAERRDVGRDLRAARARLEGMPEPADGTPDEAVDVSVLMGELRQLEKVMAANETERKAADEAAHSRNTLEREVKELDAEISNLKSLLSDARDRYEHGKSKANRLIDRAAKLVDPDLDEIHNQIASAGTINREVEKRQRREEAVDEAEEIESRHAGLEIQIEEIDAKKAEALASAPMPVDGLEISDEGVLFDGLPLSQASMSRRVRVCTAISSALNPRLRIALVRAGNDLDDESLREFYGYCAEAGLQAWVERISGIGEGALVIEAGRVASAGEEEVA